MSLDPVIRLAALHEPDAEEALRILISDGVEKSDLGPRAILEEAIRGFVAEIEAAISIGATIVTLQLDHAELVAVATKPQRRPSGRPRLTDAQQATHVATVVLANSLWEKKRKQGMKVGKAKEEAATEAAATGGGYGATLAPPTILRKMTSLRKKARV